MSQQYPSWLAFLRAWRRSPLRVGAVVETGATASRALVEGAKVGSADVVLEIGAGAGAVTREILKAMEEDGSGGSGKVLVSVERDKDLACALRDRIPQRDWEPDIHVVNGDARDVLRFLQERNLPKAHSAVTAIPWTMLTSSQQDELLDALESTMAQGAYLSAICYLNGLALPSFWKFRRKLMKRFSLVTVSGPVWRNVPPCLILSAKKR